MDRNDGCCRLRQRCAVVDVHRVHRGQGVELPQLVHNAVVGCGDGCPFALLEEHHQKLIPSACCFEGQLGRFIVDGASGVRRLGHKLKKGLRERTVAVQQGPALLVIIKFDLTKLDQIFSRPGWLELVVEQIDQLGIGHSVESRAVNQQFNADNRNHGHMDRGAESAIVLRFLEHVVLFPSLLDLELGGPVKTLVIFFLACFPLHDLARIVWHDDQRGCCRSRGDSSGFTVGCELD